MRKSAQLHNISREFNLFVPERCNPDDATSMHVGRTHEDPRWASCLALPTSSRESNGKTSFSKEDFPLVLTTELQDEMIKKYGSYIASVDSTDGTNVYNFTLTTFLVLDEYKKCVAIAHSITGQTQEMPSGSSQVCHFSCSQFQLASSHMLMPYYDAWKSVMGQPEQRLLWSTWHVDKNWREKNRSLIPGHDIPAFVCSLRALIKMSSRGWWRVS